MNTQRLEHAKKIIARLRAEGVCDTQTPIGGSVLDMGRWGITTPCGTSACLGGWFTLDPVFREQGLESDRSKKLDRNLYPHFANHTGFTSLAVFFGVDQPSSKHIIHGRNTNSFTDALERIDEVLAGASIEQMLSTREVQLRRAGVDDWRLL